MFTMFNSNAACVMSDVFCQDQCGYFPCTVRGSISTRTQRRTTTVTPLRSWRALSSLSYSLFSFSAHPASSLPEIKTPMPISEHSPSHNLVLFQRWLNGRTTSKTLADYSANAGLSILESVMIKCDPSVLTVALPERQSNSTSLGTK